MFTVILTKNHTVRHQKCRQVWSFGS